MVELIKKARLSEDSEERQEARKTLIDNCVNWKAKGVEYLFEAFEEKELLEVIEQEVAKCESVVYYADDELPDDACLQPTEITKMVKREEWRGEWHRTIDVEERMYKDFTSYRLADVVRTLMRKKWSFLADMPGMYVLGKDGIYFHARVEASLVRKLPLLLPCSIRIPIEALLKKDFQIAKNHCIEFWNKELEKGCFSEDLMPMVLSLLESETAKKLEEEINALANTVKLTYTGYSSISGSIFKDNLKGLYWVDTSQRAVDVYGDDKYVDKSGFCYLSGDDFDSDPVNAMANLADYASKDIEIDFVDLLPSHIKVNYMMLSRLQSDIHAHFTSNRQFKSEDELDKHIQEMYDYHSKCPTEPEWCPIEYLELYHQAVLENDAKLLPDKNWK